MAATVTKAHHKQVRGRGGNHSPLTGVPAAETSTHLESAAASHRGATASLLDQSEVHGGFRCKGKGTCRCRWLVLAASTHSPQAETSTHLGSVSASHRGAAASLLDQSEVHGGFRCKGKATCSCRCRCLVLAASKHSPHAKTSTHLASVSASHRGAATSLLDQSEVHGGFRCKGKAPAAGKSPERGGCRGV